MNESKEDSYFKKPINRREALRRIRGVLVGALASSLIPDNPTLLPQPSKEQFPDLLDEETLERLDIQVYPTKEVSLYLREGIFDMPLFQDLKEGRLKKIGIVLVDGPEITWNNIQKLPSDARLAWEASNLDPRELTDEYWQSNFKKEEKNINQYTEWASRSEEDLRKLATGELEEELKDKLQDYIKRSRENYQREYWQERVEDTRKELEKIANGERKPKLEAIIRRWKEYLEEANKMKGIFADKSKAVAWAMENGEEEVVGQFVSLTIPLLDLSRFDDNNPEELILKKEWAMVEGLRSKTLQEHPELAGAVFIYLAVGGDQKPRPTQSYPSPDMFKEAPWLKTKGWEDFYRYIKQPEGMAHTARHEVMHYGGSDKATSEYQADTGAFNTIVKAWEQYQENGDTKGYPFVFATNEGFTVVKRKTVSIEKDI